MTIWAPKPIKRPKVLLVDDEEEILVALEDLLDDEYDILATTDPQQALKILAQHKDVATIISDQRMPGLNGDELLFRARKISDARSLLLTGYADLDAVVSALNQGHIQGYAHKPWEEEGLRSLVREVTENSLAQRALKTEQALLRGLMESSPVGLVFTTAEGQCIRSNRRAGTDEHGRDETVHFVPALRDELGEMREAVRHSGYEERLIEEELPSGQGEGAQRWHEVTRSTLAWPQDVPSHKAWQVVIDRDVTSRVMMESRLRQTDKLQALGTLAGGIAHDFNNLLGAIAGSLELLEDVVEVGPEAQGLLENARGSVQRGAIITKRLLHFGRPQVAKLEALPFGAFLEGLRFILAQGLKTPGGKVHSALDMSAVSNDLPELWTDPGQLEMALLNLCVNARDAMPHGGTVRISARVVSRDKDGLPPECRYGEAIAIDVQDDGEGMSPEVLARVFEPFFTTKPVGKGTGLGLSSVYGFVRQCHGDVQIDSKPGQGTCVTLILPIAREGERVNSKGKKGLSKTAPRALVLDDDETVLRVTSGFLAQAGFNVVVAQRFEEAAAEVAHAPFDIAVIDMRMPDKDGQSSAEDLWALQPSLKVLFVSGYSHTDALPEGTFLLPKPFGREALLKAVHGLID
ncbi:two component hybrid sensor histidine kinase and regulator [Neokomagataea thailandica NBRC 106555]|uniref:histidine kinase n=2 Tax=Neokomagataea TaxID=1223423 RepID=A0A4Y6V622_9PROT|nr:MULTISPECIES: response regulator [Neokomagataea]QDH24071.1 hybrid sensor histidine kinase/response regulator [Neokomagataea tanensis]GBR50304.1 two component hybrid sensor histidine kinase and regulator [Neokomagataea thailandica NBRC 106555]